MSAGACFLFCSNGLTALDQEAAIRAFAAAHGVGLRAPIGSSASEAGRALNRRVELVAP